MAPELFERICQTVECSTDGLEAICKLLNSNRTTFHIYRNSSPETIDRYARAKQIQCEILADEIIEIADTTELGEKTKSTALGLEITTGDMTEHRKLRIDSRKWLLSKLMPKKYGDKLELSGDPARPLEIKITGVPSPRKAKPE